MKCVGDVVLYGLVLLFEVGGVMGVFIVVVVLYFGFDYDIVLCG